MVEAANTVEEAIADYRERYGVEVPESEFSLLCDDCDAKFLELWNALTPEEREASEIRAVQRAIN